MSGESTRRNFLKVSALGLAASAASSSPFAEVSSASAVAPGELEVWVTNHSQRCIRAKNFSWKTSGDAASGAVITLDPEQQFQTILGFGAAFTDASCYMFNQLTAPARAQLFHEMFHPSEMALRDRKSVV